MVFIYYLVNIKVNKNQLEFQTNSDIGDGSILMS